MEHLLLLLGVPEEKFGSGEVGATTDVLRAYEVLADHGALVIGAHVNSTHGVAMQGLRFGGQTKIAYTQDPHLHALEVTDLVPVSNRRSTARFFSGIKSEYPRRMHCIQGSDAHRLERDPNRESNLGVGDRPTEVLAAGRLFPRPEGPLRQPGVRPHAPLRPAAGRSDQGGPTGRQHRDAVVPRECGLQAESQRGAARRGGLRQRGRRSRLSRASPPRRSGRRLGSRRPNR